MGTNNLGNMRMYLKRLQLTNYGPIRDLDIRFPFDGSSPKPVLLVGENGSGKTIALSHIVNAMVMAKDAVYPESGELDTGKVFKLRSNSYVSAGAEYYYARCDFQSGHFVQELRLTKPKHEYAEPPMGSEGRGYDAWGAKFDSDETDHCDTNILEPSQAVTLKEIALANCLLYFPSNRFEEPAWLNQDNLRAKPRYTEGVRRKDKTQRRLIAHSALRDIYDWLYSIVYDRAAFEMQVAQFPISAFPAPNEARKQTASPPLFLGFRGDATNACESALKILRTVMPEPVGKKELRFGIGRRKNRIVSLESEQGVVVPNLFQLSSGEMALLTLFLSILRDFDLREDREAAFTSARDVRGLVVIDEVDLHLHFEHQHEILPNLVHMFPNVQFVMTTHSPLFVLGMAKKFGNDGFEVYDLPTGSRIDPESFDEFGRAFQAFKETTAFTKEIQKQVIKSQRPILYVEGPIDRDYLQHAAGLLGKSNILGKFDMQPVGGEGSLVRTWKALMKLAKNSELTEKSVVLLHDPESNCCNADAGNIHKRKMPLFKEHPIEKGVENLFDRATLERAQQQNPQFIDIVQAHNETKRGKEVPIPESWSVNTNEKRNLCDWLRSQGTAEDFRHFNTVFDMLEKIEPTGEPC